MPSDYIEKNSVIPLYDHDETECIREYKSIPRSVKAARDAYEDAMERRRVAMETDDAFA